MDEYVVLIDKEGNRVGVEEKIEAHKKGLLHKAFSVFIYNAKGEMLLQKRARSKYHFAGLWSNACCSHPRDGEETEAAAKRRLKEELGFTTNIKKDFSFIYEIKDEASGLTEHELDEVFTGNYDQNFEFNSEEVEDVRWITIENLKKELQENPELFTFWFRHIMEKLKK